MPLSTHQSGGSKHLHLQASEIVGWFVLETELPCQTLRIERPAFRIRGERHHLAKRGRIGQRGRERTPEGDGRERPS